MSKKVGSKKKIIIISLILVFILFCLFICCFIFNLKKDKEATTTQMNVVLEAYDKFSLDVDNFNDIRNQIYLDIFENTYYETLLNNDAKFKEMLSNYGKSVDSVDSSAKKLKKLCTNVYYPDSKINTKCSEYGSVYEQIVNAFVSDIDLYNENIVKYNEYQKENNGTLFLNSYVNKRKYLDFNKDGKYEGKEDN